MKYVSRSSPVTIESRSKVESRKSRAGGRESRAGQAKPSVGSVPLSRPTGEGRGEGSFSLQSSSFNLQPSTFNLSSPFLLAIALCLAPLASPAQPSSATASLAPASTGDYLSDVGVVREAQEQALDQAKQLLARGENMRDRAALETAVKEMEHSKALLEEARKKPGDLTPAIEAQQSAYQALLKLMPREFRISRSRNGAQGGGAGQPNRRELDQLEMTDEANRYETERQATTAPDARQRARVQTADRLKQLAQRQQDLNDRLRELQNSLQEARTDQQREDIRRELKRLQDQERRVLSDVDELRQQLAQSPDSAASAESRDQLDRTRSEVQRAAESLGQESPSRALAAGARAEESMQQLREDLRQKTASQFTEQMRQLRAQARQLSGRQDELARQLDSLANAPRKSLDDSADRSELARQIDRQQNGLTNLLAGMRSVTEQAESTEPLLSQQLYDALRHADQKHTDTLLQTTSQLVDRGFVSQAGETEKAARQNIHDLRQSIEHAAESILGNEADALRYAQKQLEDLTRQVEREATAGQSNAQPVAALDGALTNSAARANAAGRAGNPSTPGQRPGENGQPSPTASSASPNGREPAANRSASSGQQPGRAGSESANNNSPAEPGNSRQNQASNGNGGAGGGDGDRLRQLVERLGRANGGAAGETGPITGGNYVDWSDRMREVEQVVDSADLRNQLATVRERVGAFRGYYREYGRAPQADAVRQQVLVPMTQVRVWLQQEITRLDNANSLVPLDRDPVPDHYSELVRHYYEKLGSGQSDGAR